MDPILAPCVEADMDFSDGEIQVFDTSLDFSIGEIQTGATNMDFSNGEIRIWVTAWISPMVKSKLVPNIRISPSDKSIYACIYAHIRCIQICEIQCVQADMDFSPGETQVFDTSLDLSIGEIQTGAKHIDLSNA